MSSEQRMEVSEEEKQPASSNTTSETSSSSYGDLLGDNSKYLKMVSNDGHSMIIKREMAIKYSSTIRCMITGPGTELAPTEENVVQFPELSSRTLEAVCRWWHYKERYDSNQEGNIDEFNIEEPMWMELLMAANFLHC